MAQTFIFGSKGLIGVFAFVFWIYYLTDIEMDEDYDPQAPPFVFPAAFQTLFIGVFAVAFSIIPGGQ